MGHYPDQWGYKMEKVYNDLVSLFIVGAFGAPFFLFARFALLGF